LEGSCTRIPPRPRWRFPPRSAYFVSALFWFWYGVQKRDRNIYLPCIGWLALDGAVITGTLLYG
jgi:hypothetical protein